MSPHPVRIFLSILALITVAAPLATAVEIKSPDGKVALRFDLKPLDESKICPVYAVDFNGHPVLADSRLGLELGGGPLTSGFKIIGQEITAGDTTWEPVLGERKSIRDHYNQLVVDLQEDHPPERHLKLTFRAYDEGVALCYTLPKQAGLTDFVITRERTGFAFTGDHTAWAVYHAQGNYDPNDPKRKDKLPVGGPVPLSRIEAGVERPLTVRVDDQIYASIAEARLVDYARMKLQPTAGRNHALEALLDGEVTGRTPFTSPWRVIMVADSPGKLLEQNHLILNLNDPCALADTSWIKPGKVIRSELTTIDGKACVDFAFSHGLQFIEFDAGWYGYESDAKSDARDVHPDPSRRPQPIPLNLREVIDYANTKGIGVILYVNQLAMEKQLDEILPIYQQWGIRGVKYGFVKVGSQRWTAWLHEAIRKAADHKLMVDIHDEFRSTGYQRTFPNLMTVEGVCGNEEFPSAVHNATLPFTRCLTGPADYTFCWKNPRLQVSRAHQLAISTIFYSPWQFLFWYAKPGDVRDEPALDYWKHLPTTWDETRVLQGQIGSRAVVARRKGDEWYIGAISPGDGHFQIPLEFLSAGKQFTAGIYSDAPNGKDVQFKEQTVDAGSALEAEIPANGGMAIRLVPKAP